MRRSIIALIAAIACCTAYGVRDVKAEDQLDELFATWNAQLAELRSLVVEFTIEQRDLVFSTTHGRKTAGTLKVLRTPDHGTLALCDFGSVSHGTGAADGLLYNGGRGYLLDYDRNRGTLVAITKEDSLLALEKWIFPCASLLDRTWAEARWGLTVTSEDESHTIISMERKNPRLTGWWPDAYLRADIALVKMATSEVPQGMPSHFRFSGSRPETRFTTRSWELNGATPPLPDEFRRTEDRDGWTTADWLDTSAPAAR